MTPGLAGGPPFPAKAKKGAVVAVASAQSPTVPLMVGVCEVDVSALGRVQGAKGHAVQNIHWSGDELWSWSATGNSGREAPSQLAGWFEDEDEVEDLKAQTAALDLQDDEDDMDGGVPLTGKAAVVTGIANRDDELEGEDSTYGELSTKEIDDAFRNAFLYGIHHHKATNPKQPNFGLDFPLNMSAVMASLIQPFLPIHTPKHAAQLHIKKTSWKNMKKFIKSLDKEQIIKSKDQGKTEVVILDIDFDDPAVRNFVPYRLPKKEPAPATNGEKAPEQSETGDSSIGQTLKCVSLHKAKEKLAPLFEPSKSDPRGYYISSDIKDIVTSYIEHEQLVNPKNKRIVNLNPLLANVVFDGKGAQDKEILAKGTVARDILIERVIASCSPYHIMQRSSASSSEPPRPKSGSPPKVTILLETRSGNKTVTKVSGLEAYYINPVPLAEELRKICAGSTSVERLQGSSPKHPIMEVMVQGPQKDAVIKALEKRGVDKRWVDVVDKTKKKK
jgi:translation initiation factor 2D